jgi:hypothetical protein
VQRRIGCVPRATGPDLITTGHDPSLALLTARSSFGGEGIKMTRPRGQRTTQSVRVLGEGDSEGEIGKVRSLGHPDHL